MDHNLGKGNFRFFRDTWNAQESKTLNLHAKFSRFLKDAYFFISFIFTIFWNYKHVAPFYGRCLIPQIEPSALYLVYHCI